MIDRWFAISGGLAVASSAGSRRFDDLPVSEPMLALGVGLALGPQALGVLGVTTGDPMEALKLVARLTLAASLMAIALRYPIDDVLGEGAAGRWCRDRARGRCSTRCTRRPGATARGAVRGLRRAHSGDLVDHTTFASAGVAVWCVWALVSALR